MVSEVERAFFNKLAVPNILCSYNNGKIRTELISDSLCSMIDIDKNTLEKNLSESFTGMFHPDDVDWLSNYFHIFVDEHNCMDVTFRFMHNKDNSYQMIHAIGLWQKMSDGTDMILFYFDDIKRMQSGIRNTYNNFDKIKQKAQSNDPVTGLPNLSYIRQYADEKLCSFSQSSAKQVMIYIGVKSMRSYNDRYGYEKGDELMRLIAKALKEEFPASFCGRAVEDHFAVLDNFISHEDVIDKIERINHKVKSQAFGITEGIRAGAYVIDPEVKAMNAFDHVRQALKDIGKDMNVICRFYSEEREGELVTERLVIESFDKAIEQRLIRVFYQPIIRTKTGKICALEALARWIDPEHGMISPEKSIPVLSRYHLLHKLDLFMVEQVCREFSVRKEAGLPLVPVSVNFSAQDFDYIDVPLRLKEIINKYGIGADDIIVEITEQDVAKGTDSFKQQLSRIRENGHPLWIDDFGSGYSSINVLSQYDIDRIKFDMEFLRNLDENNGKNRRIMKAMVNMCRELDIHTLAEGVEKSDQLSFLQEIGCELSQGYFFYKPEPLETAVSNIRRQGDIIPCETKEENMNNT